MKGKTDKSHTGFFRPTTFKVVFVIVLFALIGLFYSWLNQSGGLVGSIIFGILGWPARLIVGGFDITASTIFLLALAHLIYWYILACVIAWIIRKVRRKT